MKRQPPPAGLPGPAPKPTVSAPRPRRTRQPGPVRAAAAVDLALQGGGAHGAFTWGVLDAILEDGRLRIDGISGTSAGALNAAVMACGFARDGASGARQALRDFWMDVASSSSPFGSFQGAWPHDKDLNRYNLDLNPFFLWGMEWIKALGPYRFNPLGLDPLRQVLSRHVDEKALRAAPLSVFVIATDVQTGQPEVFTGQRLSVDALLASACLPQLFKAVEVEGRAYWDGGYSGNPALWPLIYNTASSDLLLVKINPLVRPGVPDTAAEIADRINEITFNAGLVAELRAIHFVKQLLQEQRLDAGRYKDLRLHVISDDASLAPLRTSSKLNTDRKFLLALHGLGRTAALRWLLEHGDAVGRRSTVDLERRFLAPRQGRGAGETA